MKNINETLGDNLPYGKMGARANQIKEISSEFKPIFDQIVDKFSNYNRGYFNGENENNYEFGAFYATGTGERALLAKFKGYRNIVFEISFRNGQIILSQEFEELSDAKEKWYEIFNYMPVIWQKTTEKKEDKKMSLFDKINERLGTTAINEAGDTRKVKSADVKIPKKALDSLDSVVTMVFEPLIKGENVDLAKLVAAKNVLQSEIIPFAQNRHRTNIFASADEEPEDSEGKEILLLAENGYIAEAATARSKDTKAHAAALKKLIFGKNVLSKLSQGKQVKSEDIKTMWSGAEDAIKTLDAKYLYL